jgi:N-acetylglucosaminyltransferase
LIRLFLTAGLRTAFFLYLQLLLTHSLLQHRYASEHRRARPSSRGPRPTTAPAVDVWVPCYNEDPQLLEACCASLDDQDYDGDLRIFLIDDGSSNWEALRWVYESYEEVARERERHPSDGRPRWQVLRVPHDGKRMAQDAARKRSESALVMTIDSDTTVAPDGIRTMVSAFDDPTVGAVVGRIGVHNASTNRLTRMIEQLYWLLFERERAAQARFRSVLCCAGPFSLYRRSVLDRCWTRYLDQRVRGHRCKSGDDLHLTTLVLAEGYLALYEPDAVASTQVPATVRHFLRQQVRWWRSLYRELGLTRSAIGDRHWYLAFDVVARALPPLLLASTLLLAAGEGLVVGLSACVQDLALVAMLVVTYGSFAAGQAGDLRYFRAGLIQALLVPFQFYALLTCTQSDWGRREPRRLLERARLANRTR